MTDENKSIVTVRSDVIDLEHTIAARYEPGDGLNVFVHTCIHAGYMCRCMGAISARR